MINLKNKDDANKLDLSDGRLDNYLPSRVNAPKILDKMYNKFPLTDAEIDKKISDFKTNDFGNLTSEENKTIHK